MSAMLRPRAIEPPGEARIVDPHGRADPPFSRERGRHDHR